MAVVTVWIENPRCEHCASAMRLDLETAAELLRYGYAGGRWHCPLGCSEIWVKVQLDRPSVPRDRPERRGHYVRYVRLVDCGGCGIPILTKGTNTRLCWTCRAAENARRAPDTKKAAAR